jgi:hypothetical protein
MTTYYKRITGSQIQGDATAIAEQAGTLVINADGTVHIHDGTTVGGNAIGAGGGSIGSFGTDAGIGAGYNDNNPAVLFSSDDMIIRTGGTATTGGTIGAMYIASAEELVIGHSDSSLTDNNSLSEGSFTDYVVFDGNGIKMKTFRGTVQFGYNLEAPGTPIHFHINKADQGFDLFFGDDANYLHLPVGGGGPVIGANDGSSGQKLYAFGQNGTLTIPGEIDSAAGTGPVILKSRDGATTYTWTFGANGTTTFPDSLILAPASQSITLQSDQYTQLMWAHVTDQSTPDDYGNTNSDFYVESGNATLDIGYIDGTQKYVSWYWSKDGSLTFPQGGALRVGTVPSHSTGAAGDKASTVAFDSAYIYYCTADFAGTTVTGQTGSYLTSFTGINASYGFNKINTNITGWTLSVPGQSASVTVLSIDQNYNGGAQTGITFSASVTFTSTNTFTFTAPSSTNIWKRVAWSGDTW